MLSKYKLNADILYALMEKVKAKKKYGQNFLKDESVLTKIIESMPKEKRQVIEIGPGLGDLTKQLVKYKNVRAYEVDTDLIGHLQSTFDEELKSKQLELIHTDVLEAWDKQDSLFEGKYDLIANLPYYIATNIILRALEDDNCEHIIVMIQKEVAVKFSAQEKEKEFSSLAVITKLLSKDARILFDVPPESFDPAPKVVSSVLFIKKDTTKSLEKGFKEFLKTAFLQPRKKLCKNLSSKIDKAKIAAIFDELELLENVRPHEVSASLYSQIYKRAVINGRKQDTSN